MAGTLLFDGDCGFCTSAARWLDRWVPTSAGIQPWQTYRLDEAGLEPHEAAGSVQWIGDGTRREGTDAVAALLRTSSVGWRAVGGVLSAPPVRAAVGPVYRWVSRHRHQLPGGRPACAPASLPARTIRLRRRRGGDVSASVRLLRRVYDADRYPAYWPDSPREWLTDQALLAAWVVKPAASVLGHVAVGRVGADPGEATRWRETTGLDTARLGEVRQLFVSPDDRGQGIGSRLLATATDDVRSRRLLPVARVVTSSVAAVELFEQAGWRLRGIYPWGKPADGLQIRYYTGPEVRNPS